MGLSSDKLDIVNDIINNNKPFALNQMNNKNKGSGAHDRYEKYN